MNQKCIAHGIDGGCSHHNPMIDIKVSLRFEF